MKYITESYEQTVEFAKDFAKSLRPGDIVTLDGDLGAGKTAFTSGIVCGIGATDRISSPTFTIVNEYCTGKIPVFHFDVYRLSSEDDLYDIGWDDYIRRNGIVIVEWADIVRSIFDEPYYEVRITKRFDIGDDAREINISHKGEDL